MMFRVGQKVVCVDVPLAGTESPARLIENGVYTVRGVVVVDDRYAEAGSVGLLLEEIVRPKAFFGDDRPYRAEAFRPLVERKTDISFAHEIVRKVFEGVRA